MHLAANGPAMAKTTMRALLYAFAFAMVTRVISQYALGVLWVSVQKQIENQPTYSKQDWHPLTWIYLITGSATALNLESWGWAIEWTPAFIGSGMLVGMNVAASFAIGSVLAW